MRANAGIHQRRSTLDSRSCGNDKTAALGLSSCGFARSAPRKAEANEADDHHGPCRRLRGHDKADIRDSFRCLARAGVARKAAASATRRCEDGCQIQRRVRAIATVRAGIVALQSVEIERDHSGGGQIEAPGNRGYVRLRKSTVGDQHASGAVADECRERELPSIVSKSVSMTVSTIAARDGDAPSASVRPTTAARALIFIRI
jgi:hypothetical protein